MSAPMSIMEARLRRENIHMRLPRTRHPTSSSTGAATARRKKLSERGFVLESWAMVWVVTPTVPQSVPANINQSTPRLSPRGRDIDRDTFMILFLKSFNDKVEPDDR